jgi:hypothetical protein
VVSESLKNYLDARLANDSRSDEFRKTLLSELESLFDYLKKARQPFDLDWYVNQRFIDGEHFLKFDRQTGKITNQDTTDEGKSQPLRRSINLMKAQIRGLKNSVLKTPLTVEFSPAPADDSPKAMEQAEREARDDEAGWRAIEGFLKLGELRRPLVDDGFIKHSGYIGVLPTPDGFVRVDWYDGYDVYPDSTAPAFYSGRLLLLATRQNVPAIKANKAYENTAELRGDGKLAASEFKNNYEKSRTGAGASSGQGDLESVIWKQLFIRFPYTMADVTEPVEQPVIDPTTGQPQIDEMTGQPVTQQVQQPVLDESGQPKKQLQPYEDETERIWIVTFSAQDVHRIEETTFSRWPLIRYCPEQTGNRVHGKAWAQDLRDPNKTVDNMVSKAEQWHLKASPKLMVPTDSKLKEITNTTAEVLEYNARTPEGIKEFMPSGVPESMFRLVNLAQSFIADVGGVHPASAGTVPLGVKSGRGIEALQSADAEFNMAEPMENLGITWKELVERILETVSENTTEPRTLEYDDQGVTRKVRIVGEAGTKLKDGSQAQLGEKTVVVRKRHVNIRTVPEVAYTEGGRQEILMELFKVGAVDTQTLLEAYRFGNVGKIVERIIAERRDAANKPVPPKPVDADKLLNSLANLLRAGEPLTADTINSALEKAGLPPIPAELGQIEALPVDSVPAPAILK